jgi:hypothetical protein
MHYHSFFSRKVIQSFSDQMFGKNLLIYSGYGGRKKMNFSTFILFCPLKSHFFAMGKKQKQKQKAKHKNKKQKQKSKTQLFYQTFLKKSFLVYEINFPLFCRFFSREFCNWSTFLVNENKTSTF